MNVHNFSLLCRQFINFPVAVFFFLSGLFTVRNQVPKKQINRIIRIAIPYIFWFFVYFIYGKFVSDGKISLTIWEFIKLFLTGGVSAQLYYLIVLFQLQTITPLLTKNYPPHRIRLNY
jgi:fucose 4-O-acetylase-like acetyltransferase